MVIHLALLVGVVGIGAWRYGFLYAPMLKPEAVRASVEYVKYIGLTCRVLAASAGLRAGFYGLRRRSIGAGVFALAGGVAVTAVGYSLLPRCYFPGDDMTAWLIWICHGCAALAVWAATTVAGRLVWADRSKSASKDQHA
jgi:hypothetical protein